MCHLIIRIDTTAARQLVYTGSVQPLPALCCQRTLIHKDGHLAWREVSQLLEAASCLFVAICGLKPYKTQYPSYCAHTQSESRVLQQLSLWICPLQNFTGWGWDHLYASSILAYWIFGLFLTANSGSKLEIYLQTILGFSWSKPVSQTYCNWSVSVLKSTTGLHLTWYYPGCT